MSHGIRVAAGELAFALPVLIAPLRSRRSIERGVLRGLQRMHRDACEHVPYYRGDARYDRRIESIADLSALPVIDKHEVRRLGAEPFCSDRRGWYQTDQTSGSTGAVVRVRHDAVAYGYHGATVARRFLRSGYRPWWTIAQIKPFPRPQRWFQQLGMFRRTVVPSDAGEQEIARSVLALRPQLLMGYPVMLRALLRTMDADQLSTLRRRLRLVFSDSELLTESARRDLADRFGVPVCDEYSAYEVLTIGAHCRYGAMHVDEDRVHLELLGEDDRPVPDGVEGSVVVTHFRERAMPLLRYRVGDRGVSLPPGCRCGSRFRRMRLTGGRTEDYVQVPGGRRIYIPTFVGIGISVAGIGEFMVRQGDDGVITVHVVPDPSSGRTFDQVAADIRRALAAYDVPESLLRVARADRLEMTSGGKARLIRSEYRPGVDAAHQ